METCPSPCQTGKACVPTTHSSRLIPCFVQVEEVRHASECCRIVLFFHRNPYFCNTVIVKEYVMTLRGKRRLPAWVAAAGNWRLKGRASPLHIHVFLQDTGCPTALPFSGPSILKERSTAAGSQTAGSTSSAGSPTTTWQVPAGLRRWGLTGNATIELPCS